MNTEKELAFREATLSDLDALHILEQSSFDSDRLSKRRLKHWISAPQGIMLVATVNGKVAAYGLVIMRSGTRLARLYSIAVDPNTRGLGIGRQLLQALELKAVDAGKLFMRLEVASNNESAIALYNNQGYRTFGTYARYYNNEIDAIRMQKPIRQLLSAKRWAAYPWYQQTTEFTCGPSALMMAMAKLDPSIVMSQALELDIWREATTIFMTSGHGGSHPLGLALAAKRLNFSARVYINTHAPLFIDGVRSEYKKEIMRAVDKRFLEQAHQAGIEIHYQDADIATLKSALEEGCAVVSLISTYQLDGKKIPHWVTVTHIDEDCLYLHDSDPEEQDHPMDNQHIPIALDDFYKMSGFGKSRLRTTVIISGPVNSTTETLL